MKRFVLILVVILCGLLIVAQFVPKDDPSDTTPPTTTIPPTTTVPPTSTVAPTTTVPPTTTEPPVGWVEQDGKLYYYDEQSSLVTGWQEIDGVTYYFNEDGSRALGKTEIDGKTRYFAKDGSEILLVNPWNYVPEDYEPELIEITGRLARDDTKVDASCHDALLQMINDCIAEGHSIYIISSYRTQAYQEYLYNRQVNKQINNGYSREEAKIVAATISAIPGTSEHQLGLAVDLIDTAIWDLVEEQANLPGQQWLMENCWKYGFILRYPADKTDVTGIIYEPWHYRYVGTEIAKDIHESGLTLEEYLESLSY